jgi:hypothetical protein
MVKATLDIIQAIETKAENLIKKAKQEATLQQRRQQADFAEQLAAVKTAALAESEKLVQNTAVQAQAEIKQIKIETEQQLAELRAKFTNKSDLAKKELRRWL